jgi:hypothetical protein
MYRGSLQFRNGKPAGSRGARAGGWRRPCSLSEAAEHGPAARHVVARRRTRVPAAIRYTLVDSETRISESLVQLGKLASEP